MATKDLLITLFNRYIPAVYLDTIAETDMDTILDIWAEALEQATDDVTNINQLYDIDTVPVDFLPFLAYIIGYIYDFNIQENLQDDNQLRERLKQAIAWLRLKGTALGIKQYLVSLAADAEVQELWYNSDYDDLIPSVSVTKEVEDEIFREDISNNSIKLLKANAGIDTSDINDALQDFVTGSFVHTNIINGSIEVTIQQNISDVWVDKTYLIQNANNDFIYNGLSDIPVNLGEATVLGTNTENFTFDLTNNKVAFSVDGGATQQVTLPSGTKNAAAVSNAINNQTTDIISIAVGGRVQISNVSNDPDATLEVVSVINDAYDVLGLELELVEAFTKTEYRSLSEILTIQLKEHNDFSADEARVLISYQYTIYERPTSINDFEYETGAKSNWFDITMTQLNENLDLGTDTITQMIRTIKEEVKPFHALLRNVNFLKELEDIIDDDDFVDDLGDEIQKTNPDPIDFSVEDGEACCIVGNNPVGIDPIDEPDWEKVYLKGDGAIYEDDQNNKAIFHGDLGSLPKIFGDELENFVLDDTNNHLQINIPSIAFYDMKLGVGTRSAQSIADEINTLAIANIVIPAFIHGEGATEDLFVAVTSDETEDPEELIQDISIDATGTVSLELSEIADIKVMISGSGLYAQSFTNQTTVSIPAGTHGLTGTNQLQVMVLDDSTPKKVILVDQVNVDSSGNVQVDFDSLQSGKIILRHSNPVAVSYTATDLINVLGTTHGKGQHVTVHAYDSTDDNRELVNNVLAADNGDLTIELDEVSTGTLIIDNDYGYISTVRPTSHIRASGINGFVRITALDGFNRNTQSKNVMQILKPVDSIHDVLGFTSLEDSGKLCIRNYHRELVRTTLTGLNPNIIIKTYEIVGSNYEEIIPSEIETLPSGNVGITFDSAQDGLAVLSNQHTYTKVFAVVGSPWQVTITAAEHSLGASDDLAVQVYESGTPDKMIKPKEVDVTSGGDITVTFEADETGFIVVRNAPSYTKTFTSSSSISILGTEHSLSVANGLGVWVYDSTGNQILPSDVVINSVSGDISVTLDDVETGYIVIETDFEYIIPFSAPTGSVILTPSSGIYIVGDRNNEADELEIEITS